MSARPKISVLVHTLNEEANIRHCLESVRWADEIIVIDMYSDDNTVKIAQEYTGKIFMHERVGYADPARQFGLQQATGDWILVVDADEMVPLVLKKKLVAIAENDEADAVLIPHNNYFFGHKMRGTRWGPLQDMHYRFYKKNQVTFSPEVHDCIRIADRARIYKITDARLGFVHFNFLDVEQLLEKVNRYTTVEARNMYEKIKPAPSMFGAISSACKEFLSRYVKNQGYRDGMRGLVLSAVMEGYKLLAYYKYKLMQEYQSPAVREKVSAEYKQIAAQIISEYKNERHESST